MVEKNIRLKTHLGNGVYDTLHPETNSGIVRVGDKNLDETLGDVTEHLTQTDQEVMRKRELEDLSPTVLSAIEGGEGTAFNLLSVPRNNSVSEEKTTFLKTGKNLFDKNTVVKDHYVDKNTGNLIAAPGFNTSDFIPVTPNTIYTRTLSNYIAYYNESKSFISGSSASGDIFTTPNTCWYIKISVSTIRLATEQIELGAEKTPYSEYVVSLSDKIKISNLSLPDTTIDENKEVVTKGLTALIFGDSITENKNVSDDGSVFTDKSVGSWVNYAQELLKLGVVWNYAKSGAAFKDRENVEVRQKISHQVTTAIANSRPADLIIVSAGTNDGEFSLGDYDTAMSKPTLDSLDKTNLYEALRWTFWTIKKNYPDVISFVATPIQRASIETPLALYEAITKMANRYNFIVIDAMYESGIVRDFEVAGGAGRYLLDGLHPNEEGKKLMANLYTRSILNSVNY